MATIAHCDTHTVLWPYAGETERLGKKTAETIQWTRDPFDRIIVAQATLKHSPLITKDETLRKHYKHCIW
jgi:PIN domain nuclease of toxin-antitoxin system